MRRGEHDQNTLNGKNSIKKKKYQKLTNGFCNSAHYTTQSTTFHLPEVVRVYYCIFNILQMLCGRVSLVVLSRKLARVLLYADPFPTVSFILSATTHESLNKPVQRSCSPHDLGEHSRISGKDNIRV